MTANTKALTDFTEHVFRSVRAWLHALYPEPDIFISRKQDAANTSRPAFRLEMPSGPTLTPAASGFVWADYMLGITYAAEGQMDAYRVVGNISANAQPPAGRIPLRLYSWPWPVQPHVALYSNVGGTIPAEIDLTLVGEDADGNLSAPSARLALTLAAGAQLAVVLRGWQDISKVRLYSSETRGGPLKLQAVGLDGDVLTMDHVHDGAPVSASPVLPFTGIRVQSIASTVQELGDPEETYDGAVSLALRVLVPWSFVADVDPEVAP